MRIGINASFLRKPGTGIGQVSTHFLREIVKLQSTNSKYQNVEYFLYCEEQPTFDFSLPDNFQVRNFLTFWKRDDLIRKILWEWQVARKAQQDGCDVFLSLYQSSTIFQSANNDQKKNLRHVMVVHDIIPRLLPAYQGTWRQKWYWKMVEAGIRRAHSIVTVSEATRNDLVALGIERSRMTVVYPDTAPLFLQPPTVEASSVVLEKYGLKPGYIYHGGGMEIRKNTRRLLEAYQLLVAKEGNGVLRNVVPPLIISGTIFSESNPLATPVRSLVEELALEDRVHLLGFVPEGDLPSLYQNALFFAYPSLYEGFGLPVLEALRMGTPVLASEIASLPEVAGDAALYVDPSSVSSIASGMERLITDASLRASLSQASNLVRSRYSWQRFTEHILQIVKQ